MNDKEKEEKKEGQPWMVALFVNTLYLYIRYLTLFVSRRHRFRKQHKQVFGLKQYDRVFCEQLVEELDKTGRAFLAMGDFHGALDAFRHSLRVRTEAKVDFTQRSLAQSIGSIADVYSRQLKWSQALQTYLAALQALQFAEDCYETKRLKSYIERNAAFAHRKLTTVGHRFAV